VSNSPQQPDFQQPSSYPGTRSVDQPPLGYQRVQVKTPQNRPVVTITFIALAVIVFLLQEASIYLFGYDRVAIAGMKVNELIMVGQYWRLFTPMLLHGSVIHLLVNMYALYIFGPGLERYYGHWRFLLLFVVSGFAGNVFSFMFSLAPSLGSSTAIFGLLGAEAVFLYRNQKILGGAARRALTNLIVIAVINLFIGLSPGLNIDIWGHIGGLIGGTIFAWIGGPLLEVTGGYGDLQVEDQHTPRDIAAAAVLALALFAIFALVTIYLRGN
jgi:rhomboid protease GluP